MLVSSGSRSGSWQSPQAALAAPLAEQGEGEGEEHHCDGGSHLPVLDSEEHGSWDPCGRILGWWTRVEWSNMYHTYRVLFLTAPPDFQYQNEKQVTANQDYFFKKFSMSSSLAEQVCSFWY